MKAGMKFRNKIKSINRTVIFIVSLSLIDVSLSQSSGDLTLVNGKGPELAVDEGANFHLIWGGGADAIWYGIFDSTGKSIKKIKLPGTEGCCGEANFALKNDNAVIAWRFISQTFNSYIFGQVFSDSQDSINSNYISFFDTYFDAERYNPEIDFLNDTTFIVTWYGNGPQTPSPQLGIYGEISTTSLSALGGNFLINDYLENTDARIQKILVSKDSSSFLAVWNDNRSKINKVYGRFFDIEGNAKGNSFLISDSPDSAYIFYLNGAVDKQNGNYIIIWEQVSDNISQIRWRWIDNTGKPVEESQSITDPNIDSMSGEIDTDEKGKIIIVWQQRLNGYLTIFGRRYIGKNQPFGDTFKISITDFKNTQTNAKVKLKGDKIFVVWQQQKDSTIEICARIIDFNDTTLVDIHEDDQLIYSLSLEQNYPNPFNQSTIIGYSVPKIASDTKSDVKLIIYDVLGNEIAVLVNEENNSGNYRVEFGSPKIASGIYFYQLQFGDQRLTKKMVLIK